MNGYIALHRKTIDSNVFKDPELFKLWCYCLMRANHKPREVLHGGQVVNLDAGSFITGRKVLVSELDMTEQKIRTRLAILEKMGNLTIKSTNKYSVITVVNWDYYQTNRNNLTNKYPTNNQQITTDNNVNKDNNTIGDKSPEEEIMWNKKSDDYEEGVVDLDGSGEVVNEEQSARAADRANRQRIKKNLKLVEELRGLAYTPTALNSDVKVYQQLEKQGWSGRAIIEEYVNTIESEYWVEKKKHGEYPSLMTVEFKLRNKKPR